MRARVALFGLALVAGCTNVRPCKAGTALLALTLDAASAGADALVVAATVDGATLTDTVAHTPGATTGTLELDFPSYPEGKPVQLAVRATAGGNTVGSGSLAQTLPAGCASLAMTVQRAGSNDLGPGGDLGAPTCAMDTDCASQHCVDGVCCNTACSGQCEACDVAGNVGTCSAVTNGQPHGKRTPCMGAGTTCGGTCAPASTTACTFPGAATQCRAQSCTGSTKTIAATCDSMGGCPLPSTVTCPFGCAGSDCMNACVKDTDCAANMFCNSGACLSTRPAGRACTAPGDCTNGFCVDNFCCSSASCGACLSCGVAGSEGSCRALASGVADGRCAPAPPCGLTGACDGSGHCANVARSTQCGTTSVCSADNSSVSKNKVCDGNGACVQAPFVTCSPYVCSGTTTNGGCYTQCSACDSPVLNSCGSGTSGQACAAGHSCVITDFCCNDPSCTCQPYHCQ